METADFWKALDNASMSTLNMRDTLGNRFYGYKGDDAQEVFEKKTLPANAIYELRTDSGHLSAFIVMLEAKHCTEIRSNGDDK